MKKKIKFTILISFFLIILKFSPSLAVEIPQVYFEGDISNMTDKKEQREILLKYVSPEMNFEKNAKIKLQGSSSLAYPKKNYTIEFYEDIDMGQGWGEQSKYNLKANWTDKTAARNVVTAKIAGSVQKKYEVLDDLPNNGSIDGFPVEVYINNEFLGLYTWNIPKSAWMWNMDKDNPDHIVLGGDWYTEYVNLKKELDDFDGTGWDFEVGTKNDELIKNFNKLVRFINNSSDEEFIRDFESYINKDAWLNYIVMIYMIQGVDNTGKNMMLVTYNNGQTWYPCLYDLDGTFGELWDGTLSDSYKILPEEPIADHSTNNLIVRTIKCFPDEISNRWFSLRKNIFTKENILDEFNIFISSIPEEVYKKENEKWTGRPGDEITQIEEFLDYRLPYIDKIMYDRYTKINWEDVRGYFKIATGKFLELRRAHFYFK